MTEALEPLVSFQLLNIPSPTACCQKLHESCGGTLDKAESLDSRLRAFYVKRGSNDALLLACSEDTGRTPLRACLALECISLGFSCLYDLLHFGIAIGCLARVNL